MRPTFGDEGGALSWAHAKQENDHGRLQAAPKKTRLALRRLARPPRRRARERPQGHTRPSADVRNKTASLRRSGHDGVASCCRRSAMSDIRSLGPWLSACDQSTMNNL